MHKKIKTEPAAEAVGHIKHPGRIVSPEDGGTNPNQREMFYNHHCCHSDTCYVCVCVCGDSDFYPACSPVNTV